MKVLQYNVILKIDLEKVFDRLEWFFIHNSLHLFNFPPKLTKLIMSCVSTSSFFILINGSSTQPFTLTRGIKQGDPISPYLFIICMKRLARDIDNQVVSRS